MGFIKPSYVNIRVWNDNWNQLIIRLIVNRHSSINRENTTVFTIVCVGTWSGLCVKIQFKSGEKTTLVQNIVMNVYQIIIMSIYEYEITSRRHGDLSGQLLIGWKSRISYVSIGLDFRPNRSLSHVSGKVRDVPRARATTTGAWVANHLGT